MIKIANEFPAFSSRRIHVKRVTGRFLKGGEEVNLDLKPGDVVTITCPREKADAYSH